MPQQLLGTSDGTGPSDWVTVRDSDDLMVLVSPGNAPVVRSELKVDGNSIRISGSTVDGEGTSSLDLIPDNSSLRVNITSGTADVFLDGNFVT